MNFDEIAERIIKTEGMTFALAVANIASSNHRSDKAKSGDLAEARYYLKQAIVQALADAQAAGRRRDE